MTTGVVQQIDVRAFPMEIAKKLLTLGHALSMTKGPTAYYEAEKSLVTFLESLSTYHDIIWPSAKNTDYRLHQRFVEKFVCQHRDNRNLIASQARTLLDAINFFPVASDYPYEEKLDYDERTGN